MPFTKAPHDASMLFTVNSMDMVDGAALYFNAAPGSTAWPLTNLALFVPFSVPSPCVALEGWANCGTTAAGNFDIGIYDTAGNRLTSSGSTAKTASTPKMTAGMTDYTLSPDIVYYLGMSADGTNNYIALTAAAGLYEAAGILEMQTAFVLPNPATFALTTRAFLPQFGVNFQATGF